jgi:Lrp/AsnC family transcriptional regulator, regulator for asnA, asnC and gidA
MNSHASSRLNQPELEPPNPEDLEVLDLRILGLLQQDSRLSFNKIARKLGISVGTAFNHIKNLEKKGVLKGYTILLDSNRVGFSLTTLIMVQVEGGHLLDVEDEVSKAPNVVAVYDITGDYDAAVIAKFKDRDCLNSFIKSLMAIPHVKRTVTSVVLDVIKEDLQVNLEKAGKRANSTC